ncbi:MAG: hypothetical protein ACMUIM_09010, partial [bacterium]
MIKKILKIFSPYEPKGQRKKIVSCEKTLNKAIRTENKCHRKYLQKQLYFGQFKKSYSENVGENSFARLSASSTPILNDIFVPTFP